MPYKRIKTDALEKAMQIPEGTDYLILIDHVLPLFFVGAALFFLVALIVTFNQPRVIKESNILIPNVHKSA